MTIYYTYCSYETDRGCKGLAYIGSRKCPVGKTPETDNYFGSPQSPKNKEFKENSSKDKVILGKFNTREEAMAHEIWLHKFYDVARNPRFANQCRATSTGFSCGLSGENNPMFGKNHKPESLQKMSDSRKGENNPNFGKKLDPQTRQKISEARKGKPGLSGEDHPNYGKNLDPQTRQKISESMKGEKHPNYGKRGEGTPMFGKNHSPETCQKMSESWEGGNNPRFDPTPYNFENKKLGVVEMQVTRNSMSKKYAVSSQSLGFVVKGECRHHKGWTLLTQDQIPDKTS